MKQRVGSGVAALVAVNEGRSRPLPTAPASTTALGFSSDRLKIASSSPWCSVCGWFVTSARTSSASGWRSARGRDAQVAVVAKAQSRSAGGGLR